MLSKEISSIKKYIYIFLQDYTRVNECNIMYEMIDKQNSLHMYTNKSAVLSFVIHSREICQDVMFYEKFSL